MHAGQLKLMSHNAPSSSPKHARPPFPALLQPSGRPLHRGSDLGGESSWVDATRLALFGDDPPPEAPPT
eukprot:1879946-Rhodomonas_salina.1